TILNLWKTLGVERDEVHGNRAASRRALAGVDVLEKILEKKICLGAARTRTRRTTNPGTRQRSPHTSYRVVIKLPVFFRRSVPVVDVRLVPNFEVPLQHRIFAITLN